MAKSDEKESRKSIPYQHKMIGGLGREGKLPDVAAAEAVRHAYGRSRSDGYDYHEGTISESVAYLIGTHGFFAKPSHHYAYAHKSRRLKKHLHGYRQAYLEQTAHTLA